MSRHTFPLEVSTRQPYLPVRLSNPNDDFEQYHETLALIDTGSDSSIVPFTVSNDLMHHNDASAVETKTVLGIGGRITTYKHTFILEVLALNGEILFTTSPMFIEVSEGNYGPVILGMKDFIAHYVESINFKTNILTIRY